MYGGTLPALIWHDFMLSAMEGMRVREFATPTTEGYTQSPPTPVTSPQPSPTVTETPEPEPTKEPKPEPTQEPQPTQTPEPTGPTGASGATGAFPSPTP